MTELITRMNEAMPLGYQLAFLIRVLVATLCGGAIGLERTKRLKEAGIRTHCLVCCASALIMIVSKYAFADLSVGDAFFFGDRGADPARIAAQVLGKAVQVAPDRRIVRKKFHAKSASFRGFSSVYMLLRCL